MTNVLKREGRGRKTVAQRDGHGETRGETGVTTKGQGTLEATRSWKRHRKMLLSSLQREHGLVNILIWDFWPPESWKNTVLLF